MEILISMDNFIGEFVILSMFFAAYLIFKKLNHIKKQQEYDNNAQYVKNIGELEEIIRPLCTPWENVKKAKEVVEKSKKQRWQDIDLESQSRRIQD